MPSRLRRPRALIVTVCLAAALGAPAAALAQSAGDDQYQDPLAGGTSTQTAPSTPSVTSTPQLTPSAGTSGTGGSTPAAGTTTTGPATTSGGSPAQATTSSLPNTGVDGRIVAALGAGFLLCGVALRLRTSRERL